VNVLSSACIVIPLGDPVDLRFGALCEFVVTLESAPHAVDYSVEICRPVGSRVRGEQRGMNPLILTRPAFEALLKVVHDSLTEHAHGVVHRAAADHALRRCDRMVERFARAKLAQIAEIIDQVGLRWSRCDAGSDVNESHGEQPACLMTHNSHIRIEAQAGNSRNVFPRGGRGATDAVLEEFALRGGRGRLQRTAFAHQPAPRIRMHRAPQAVSFGFLYYRRTSINHSLVLGAVVI
jgi:hypothetical protein